MGFGDLELRLQYLIVVSSIMSVMMLSYLVYKKVLLPHTLRLEARWEAQRRAQQGSADLAVYVDDSGAAATGDGTVSQPQPPVLVTEQLVREALSSIGGEVPQADIEDPQKGLDIETCSICLEDFEFKTGRTLFRAPTCTHTYHMDCIAKWVHTRATIACPMCKTPFLEDGDDTSPMQTLLRHTCSATSEAGTHSVELNPP